MREYMITVTGGAVLAAVAHMISPEKWTKYIRIITGIMIVSIIVSPVSVLIDGDIFSGYGEYSFDGEYLQQEAVNEEMEKKLAEDVVRRIKSEYGEEAEAEVVLTVNDRMQIEGVGEVKIWNVKNREAVRELIQKVYMPLKISFPD